jgi:hypothetical protein
MGWTPRQVAETSLWKYMAAVDGYARANGSGSGMDDKTFDELSAMVDDAMEKA